MVFVYNQFLKCVLSSSVPTIPIDQLPELEEITILDSRTPAEYAISRIPGAIWVGWELAALTRNIVDSHVDVERHRGARRHDDGGATARACPLSEEGVRARLRRTLRAPPPGPRSTFSSGNSFVHSLFRHTATPSRLVSARRHLGNRGSGAFGRPTDRCVQVVSCYG